VIRVLFAGEQKVQARLLRRKTPPRPGKLEEALVAHHPAQKTDDERVRRNAVRGASGEPRGFVGRREPPRVDALPAAAEQDLDLVARAEPLLDRDLPRRVAHRNNAMSDEAGGPSRQPA